MEVRKCSKGLQAPFLSVSADEVGVLRVPEGKAGVPVVNWVVPEHEG